MSWMNWENLSTKSLRTQLRIARRRLAHKLTVQARHEPGTAYHTRAAREAETYRSREVAILRELTRRGE